MPDLRSYRFEGLWHDGKWMMPAHVHLEPDGTIKTISEHPQKESKYERISGLALPGISNAHSHAFQYAMAGLTELHDITGTRDDFWGWREAMYQLALSIDP